MVYEKNEMKLDENGKQVEKMQEKGRDGAEREREFINGILYIAYLEETRSDC